MNWPVIIILAVAVVGLILFLVKRNLRDKRDLENKLNRDYRKPDDGDVEIDEKTK